MSVEDSIKSIDELTARLKDSFRIVQTREEEFARREKEIQDKLQKLEDQEAELSSYKKVSWCNQLYKQIEELKCQNRLLTRSNEALKKYLRERGCNRENVEKISCIEDTSSASKNIKDSEDGGDEEQTLNTSKSQQQTNQQLDRGDQEETVDEQVEEQEQEEQKEREEQVEKHIEEQVVETVDKQSNDQLSKTTTEQGGDEQVDKKGEDLVEEEGEGEEEEDLEEIIFKGNTYNTDLKYLYDVNTGNAVGYKYKKSFRLYKKKKSGEN